MSLYCAAPVFCRSEFHEFIRSVAKKAPDAQERSMTSIRAGSRFKFKNGKTLHFGELFTVGNVTALYTDRDNPNWLIRIPLDATETYAKEITAMFDGYEVLKKYMGDAVVDVLDSSPGEYVRVSRLPADTKSPHDLKFESKELREKALKALVKFAESTAAFDVIGDFRLDQLHYISSENRWMLADWEHHKSYNSDEGGSHLLFDPKNPEELRHSNVLAELYDLVGVTRGSKGFSPKKSNHWLSLSEDFALQRKVANDIEKAVLKRRRKLAKNADFIKEAARYSHPEGIREIFLDEESHTFLDKRKCLQEIRMFIM